MKRILDNQRGILCSSGLVKYRAIAISANATNGAKAGPYTQGSMT